MSREIDGSSDPSTPSKEQIDELVDEVALSYIRRVMDSMVDTVRRICPSIFVNLMVIQPDGMALDVSSGSGSVSPEGREILARATANMRSAFAEEVKRSGGICVLDESAKH
jgi:hypothetical protein